MTTGQLKMLTSIAMRQPVPAGKLVRLGSIVDPRFAEQGTG